MRWTFRFLLILSLSLVTHLSFGQVRISLSVAFTQSARSVLRMKNEKARALVIDELKKNPALQIVNEGRKHGIDAFITIIVDISQNQKEVLMCAILLSKASPENILQGCPNISQECVDAIDTRLESIQIGWIRGTLLLSGPLSSLENLLRGMGHGLTLYYEPRL